MIQAIIVDDERYAREELEALLAQDGDIRVTACCANAIEALKEINSRHPDVVFLDIQMPQISGMELIGMLDPDAMPRIVFVTAYDEYAVKAFEDNAFDYLLKPIERPRLNKTLERLKRDCAPQPVARLAAPQLTQIPCYRHNRIRLVRAEEIEYAYSELSGVHVATADETAHTHLPLKVLEQKAGLLRCHRQYLIRPEVIHEIQLLEQGLAEIHTRSGQVVPVSRRYLKALKDRFGFR
ncbi:two-component system response regulator YehT [Billgrantia azerbaijanica]|nr:two-component system response regulator YehT [Halomonas azerbaijanica]